MLSIPYLCSSLKSTPDYAGIEATQKTATFTLISVACDFIFILGTALITRNLHYIVLGVMFSALLQWGYAQYNLGRYFTKVTFDPDFYREIFSILYLLVWLQL